MTLVEVMVGASIAVFVAGGAMMLFLETSREQRRGVADATTENVAGKLQDQLMVRLRTMSAAEGVIFSQPTTNNPTMSWRMIVARGPAPAFPREEIYFDVSGRRAMYDPDRAVSGNEQVLLATNPSSFVLRNVCFFPSLKADGTPENSLVNVVIELDDNGSSGRNAGGSNPARVQRSFAVKMRNG
jgi:hypothetical protein